MNAPNLTAKQQALYGFLRKYMQKNDGVAPSFKEMMAGINCKSSSEIHAMLTAMERRGAIKRMKGLARAIELTKP